MRINPKLAASALGLFVVVTASIHGALDYGTEEMHWPTGPVSVQATDMHWPTGPDSVQTTTEDMHWPTGPDSVEAGIFVDANVLPA